MQNWKVWKAQTPKCSHYCADGSVHHPPPKILQRQGRLTEQQTHRKQSQIPDPKVWITLRCLIVLCSVLIQWSGGRIFSVALFFWACLLPAVLMAFRSRFVLRDGLPMRWWAHWSVWNRAFPWNQLSNTWKKHDNSCKNKIAVQQPARKG